MSSAEVSAARSKLGILTGSTIVAPPMRKVSIVWFTTASAFGL